MISKMLSLIHTRNAVANRPADRVSLPMDALLALERRRDVVAPSSSGVIEEQVARFLEPRHHAEHLRLPPPAPASGPAVRGAVSRILALAPVDVEAPSEFLAAEAEMMRMLSGYRVVIEEILRRSSPDAARPPREA
ncbi:MAG: hypothetical protein HY791_15540 [Deltaproteobacteria bacterium]|nr:hypothetical protein [Deltaproteobacteria bacterium]